MTGSLPRSSMGNKRTSASLNLDDAADYRGKLFIKEGSLNLRSEYVSTHHNSFEVEISNIKLTGIRNTGEELQLVRNDGQEYNFPVNQWCLQPYTK